VYGFTVQMEPAPGIEPEQLGAAFLRLLEERGLQDLGRGDASVLEFLVASDGGQATADDRDAVVAWLHARSEVSDFGVGPLVDLDDAA
jgi:uncharacterized protein YggL (DUF469 family)